MSDLQVWDLGDGLYVDDQGEIVEGDADGALARACAQIADWQRQVKVYEQAIAAGKALVAKRQQGKREVHGDYVASVRSATRRELDLERLRTAMAFWGATEVQEMARAAKAFDMDRLPDQLRTRISTYIEEVRGREYVVIAPVMRPAPEPVEVAS